MKQLALIVGVLVLVVLAAYLLVTGSFERRAAEREARAFEGLAERPFAAMVQGADLVVIEDGEDGWFELDMAALPEDISIGFHGPRFFDILTGSQHVAIYCTRPGKIIWAIENDQIEQDYGFCNTRRMDLSNVRPFAARVEMITQQRTRTEIEALRAEVAADPARAMIASPQSMSPYNQRIVVTPPLMWFITGSGMPRHEVEAAIQAGIVAQMGEVDVSFHRRPASNPNLALPDGEPQTGGGANMAMQQGGGYIVIPGVWAEPYEIWIECNPEVCATANDLDLDAIFATARDLVGLRRAIAGVSVDARSNPPTPLEDFPDMDDLMDTSVTIADPVPVTYQIRYIRRP